MSSPQPLRIENKSPGALALRSLRDWLGEGRWAAGDLLPTEEDLCERLHVSRGTIRGALKRLENEGMLQATRGRGRVVLAAKSSSTGLMAKTIAVVGGVPSQPDQLRRKQFEKAIGVGAMDAIHDAGMGMLLLHSDHLAGAELDQFLENPPRGIVAMVEVGRTAEGRQLLSQLFAAGIPIVINSDGPELTRYDRVISDHDAGSYQLTRWLIERGCRRILRVFSGPLGQYWMAGRNSGHERALQEKGIAPITPTYAMEVPDGAGFGDSGSREHFDSRTRHYAGFLVEHLVGKEPVDAIMAHTDGNVFPLAAACRLFGKEPNRDIALVGYDAYWQDWAERRWEPSVPLATVNKHNHETGQAMVRSLLDRIHGKSPAESQLLMLKPELAVTGDERK